MKWQGLVAQEQNVAALVEADALLAIEQQSRFLSNLLDAWVNAVRIDGVGHQPTESEHDGGVGAVPLARGPQGAVQPGLDAADPAQLSVLRQPPHKHGSGLHRPYRVRRRRADADLEQVKNTQGHDCLSN